LQTEIYGSGQGPTPGIPTPTLALINGSGFLVYIKKMLILRVVVEVVQCVLIFTTPGYAMDKPPVFQAPVVRKPISANPRLNRSNPATE